MNRISPESKLAAEFRIDRDSELEISHGRRTDPVNNSIRSTESLHNASDDNIVHNNKRSASTKQAKSDNPIDISCSHINYCSILNSDPRTYKFSSEDQHGEYKNRKEIVPFYTLHQRAQTKRWSEFFRRTLAFGFNGCSVVIGVILIFDYYILPPCNPSSASNYCPPFGMEFSEWRNVLGNFPEIILSIIGIAITIISFILELSATRYSTSIISLFFLDHLARYVMQFFVTTSLMCLWINFTLRKDSVPQVFLMATYTAMSISMVIIIPFFKYVFTFTYPSQQISILLKQASGILSYPQRSHILGNLKPVNMSLRHKNIIKYMQIMAGYAHVSIDNNDSYTCYQVIHAIAHILCDYIGDKHKNSNSWFELSPYVRLDSDFESISKDALKDLIETCSWFEWKMFCIYHNIFTEAALRMPGACRQLSLCTRFIGEAAMDHGDMPVLQLAMKFFNTFLRIIINERHVSIGCHTLHQYRLLCEGMIRLGQHRVLEEAISYFKYYSHTAVAQDFITFTEYCAYDVAQLCEFAHERKYEYATTILKILLEIDRIPEMQDEEHTLIGVRKAQIKLGTFYLIEGARDLALLIRSDMQDETEERLLKLKLEMMVVSGNKYWEKEDRGDRFDYLSPERLERLDEFFDLQSEGSNSIHNYCHNETTLTSDKDINTLKQAHITGDSLEEAILLLENQHHIPSYNQAGDSTESTYTRADTLKNSHEPILTSNKSSELSGIDFIKSEAESVDGTDGNGKIDTVELLRHETLSDPTGESLKLVEPMKRSQANADSVSKRRQALLKYARSRTSTKDFSPESAVVPNSEEGASTLKFDSRPPNRGTETWICNNVREIPMRKLLKRRSRETDLLLQSPRTKTSGSHTAHRSQLPSFPSFLVDRLDEECGFTLSKDLQRCASKSSISPSHRSNHS